MTVLEVAAELELGRGGLEGRDEDADNSGVREERLDEETVVDMLRGRRDAGTAVCVEVVE